MWSGPASLYVLIALASEPQHGLGIAENVATFTEDRVLLGPGTLYRVLKDLSSSGLIERADPPDDDDPRRKFYAITHAGREELSTAVKELSLVHSAASSRLQESHAHGSAS